MSWRLDAVSQCWYYMIADFNKALYLLLFQLVLCTHEHYKKLTWGDIFTVNDCRMEGVNWLQCCIGFQYD